MRQRLPYYLSAGLVLFAAYAQFLSMGWEPAATAAILAILIGIFAVTGFEAWLHERWTDPDDMPAESEPEPAPIEAALLADLAQDQAVLDDIRGRYLAAQQDVQRYLDSVIADMRVRFDQVRFELGVSR